MDNDAVPGADIDEDEEAVVETDPPCLPKNAEYRSATELVIGPALTGPTTWIFDRNGGSALLALFRVCGAGEAPGADGLLNSSSRFIRSSSATVVSIWASCSIVVSSLYRG